MPFVGDTDSKLLQEFDAPLCGDYRKFLKTSCVVVKKRHVLSKTLTDITLASVRRRNIFKSE